jgi:hypothetical protein
MPATVDSAAIAGMIDLLRVQGCFALSARYAVCFKTSSEDVNPMDPNMKYPSMLQYEEIGKVFENALIELVHKEENVHSLEDVSASEELRQVLMFNVKSALIKAGSLSANTMRCTRTTAAIKALDNFFSLDVEDEALGRFVCVTVDTFFDNDLLNTTRIFMENAKGSFGLCVATSMDAHRQVVFAAKGQTLSVAFYPRKGVVCYGSEAAAVKVSPINNTPCLFRAIFVNGAMIISLLVCY